jgi:hypothetical protein
MLSLTLQNRIFAPSVGQSSGTVTLYTYEMLVTELFFKLRQCKQLRI